VRFRRSAIVKLCMCKGRLYYIKVWSLLEVYSKDIPNEPSLRGINTSFEP